VEKSTVIGKLEKWEQPLFQPLTTHAFQRGASCLSARNRVVGQPHENIQRCVFMAPNRTLLCVLRPLFSSHHFIIPFYINRLMGFFVFGMSCAAFLIVSASPFITDWEISWKSLDINLYIGRQIHLLRQGSVSQSL
jgi:hypothetical protein